MCEHCHHYPHLPGCPNEEGPKRIAVCAYCREDIVPGDTYAEFDERCYHEECLYDAAPSILMKSGDALLRKGQQNPNLPVAVIGRCAYCADESAEVHTDENGDILSNEDAFECDGKLYHYDCFLDIAKSILFETDMGVIKIAEDEE